MSIIRCSGLIWLFQAHFVPCEMSTRFLTLTMFCGSQRIHFHHEISPWELFEKCDTLISSLLIIDCKYFYRLPRNVLEGNVFSRACLLAILFTGGGHMWPLPMMHWTSQHNDLTPSRPLAGTLWPWSQSPLYRNPSNGHIQNLFNLDLTIQGPLPRHNQTCSTSAPLYRDPKRQVQTCSLWNIYGWQAGGWHPTGMLSCNVFIQKGWNQNDIIMILIQIPGMEYALPDDHLHRLVLARDRCPIGFRKMKKSVFLQKINEKSDLIERTISH